MNFVFLAAPPPLQAHHGELRFSLFDSTSPLGRGPFSAASKAVYAPSFPSETPTLPVTLKIYDRAALGPSSSLRVRQIQQQALLAGSMIGHPNLLPVYGLWEDPLSSSVVLLMKLADRGNLYEEMARGRGRLPGGRIAQVTRTILSALESIHARGLAHGNLKPQNVLFGNECTEGAGSWGSEGPSGIYLSDLGLALSPRHPTAAAAAAGPDTPSPTPNPPLSQLSSSGAWSINGPASACASPTGAVFLGRLRVAEKSSSHGLAGWRQDLLALANITYNMARGFTSQDDFVDYVGSFSGGHADLQATGGAGPLGACPDLSDFLRCILEPSSTASSLLRHPFLLPPGRSPSPPPSPPPGTTHVSLPSPHYSNRGPLRRSSLGAAATTPRSSPPPSILRTARSSLGCPRRATSRVRFLEGLEFDAGEPEAYRDAGSSPSSGGGGLGESGDSSSLRGAPLRLEQLLSTARPLRSYQVAPAPGSGFPSQSPKVLASRALQSPPPSLRPSEPSAPVLPLLGPRRASLDSRAGPAARLTPQSALLLRRASKNRIQTYGDKGGKDSAAPCTGSAALLRGFGSPPGRQAPDWGAAYEARMKGLRAAAAKGGPAAASSALSGARSLDHPPSDPALQVQSGASEPSFSFSAHSHPTLSTLKGPQKAAAGAAAAAEALMAASEAAGSAGAKRDKTGKDASIDTPVIGQPTPAPQKASPTPRAGAASAAPRRGSAISAAAAAAAADAKDVVEKRVGGSAPGAATAQGFGLSNFISRMLHPKKRVEPAPHCAAL